MGKRRTHLQLHRLGTPQQGAICVCHVVSPCRATWGEDGENALWDHHPQIKPPCAGCWGTGHPGVLILSPTSSHTSFPSTFIAVSSSSERYETLRTKERLRRGCQSWGGFGTGCEGRVVEGLPVGSCPGGGGLWGELGTGWAQPWEPLLAQGEGGDRWVLSVSAPGAVRSHHRCQRRRMAARGQSQGMAQLGGTQAIAAEVQALAVQLPSR